MTVSRRGGQCAPLSSPKRKRSGRHELPSKRDCGQAQPLFCFFIRMSLLLTDRITVVVVPFDVFPLSELQVNPSGSSVANLPVRVQPGFPERHIRPADNELFDSTVDEEVGEPRGMAGTRVVLRGRRSVAVTLSAVIISVIVEEDPQQPGAHCGAPCAVQVPLQLEQTEVRQRAPVLIIGVEVYDIAASDGLVDRVLSAIIVKTTYHSRTHEVGCCVE
ncbi:hypothetical protein GE09DRAFT_477071 [Coniochaeta sp. 2T2.1]|nr:hypothetical protein GE09DRAFT_477071 [Coniochaeta sp. 2T2.1]